MNAVEEKLSTNCVFMQGASGDLSTMSAEQTRGIEAFGKAMGTQVAEVAGSIETKKPERSRLRVWVQEKK